MSLNDKNKLVLTECSVATMNDFFGELGLIEDASIVIEGDKIVWVGKSKSVPKEFINYPLKKLTLLENLN